MKKTVFNFIKSINTSNAYTNYSNYLSNLEMYKLNEYISIKESNVINII